MCTAVENMFLLDMSNELWLHFKWIGSEWKKSYSL